MFTTRGWHGLFLILPRPPPQINRSLIQAGEAFWPSPALRIAACRNW